MDGTMAHGRAEKLYARRLVYTAVTRARMTVVIVGQRRILTDAIARHDDARRRTALPLYLSGGVAF
jgi:ATP-dependent exoDNAse (exonuclease V) alpha subunit